jgi:lipooligosaccharide transport system permease protein
LRNIVGSQMTDEEYAAAKRLRAGASVRLVDVGLSFAGPALVMSALSRNYDFVNYYFVLAVTPMLILCGVFYPVEGLPEAMQTSIQALPLTHAVALTRPLVAGMPVSDVLLHLLVLAAYGLVGLHLALILARRRLLV